MVEVKRSSDRQSFSACRMSALATPLRLKDSSTQISQTNPRPKKLPSNADSYGLCAAQDHSSGIRAAETGDVEISGIRGAAQEARMSVVLQRPPEIRVGVELVRLRSRNLNSRCVHLEIRVIKVKSV